MGRGGAKHFSKWKLNDKYILTVLVKGVGTFSSSKKGGGIISANDGVFGACFYAFNCLIP